MRLRHLLSASLLCWAGMAGARDVHGVNGYYNWTAAQMQANAQIEFGSEGKNGHNGSRVMNLKAII